MPQVLMPQIALIVARSVPGSVIGCEGKLPWRLRSDLQRFRRLTTGHAVIMGSKTFASIGRPLPHRCNIILSRESRPAASAPKGAPDIADGGALWAASRDAALLLADLISIACGNEKIFVIGGEEIYDLFLKDGLVDVVYLTEVLKDIRGDAHFAHDFGEGEWRRAAEESFTAGEGDESDSRLLVYARQRPRPRGRPQSFLRSANSFEAQTPGLADFLKAREEAIMVYAKRHRLDSDCRAF